MSAVRSPGPAIKCETTLLPGSGAAAGLRVARLDRTLGPGSGGVQPIPGATSGESVVEQLVRDIDRGPALRVRYLLDQRGQPRGEVGRKIHQTLGAADRGYSGDYSLLPRSRRPALLASPMTDRAEEATRA